MQILKKQLALLFIFFVFSFFRTYATHYRAGEIIYKLVAEFQYECSVVTYSKTSSFQADRDFVEIEWGDGTMDTIARVNGPVIGGLHKGEELDNDIKKNIYVGRHTYPGVPSPPNRFYIISFLDVNRIDGIANIGNGQSVDVPFYVEDTIKFPTDLANIGFNSSPELLYAPIDFANLNDTFYHNPGAFDPDGDSLIFELMPCLQGQSQNVPLYVYPDDYCQLLQPNNTFTIDRHTGQIVWATPCQLGIFNIAILIHEYRNGVNMGTLIRDMQIIVLNENNNPPRLTAIRDTCIRAGSQLKATVSAIDNISQTVELSAVGGPFVVTSPATFNTINGNPATGTFTWNTTCSHIQRQPYLVIFKAEDNFSPPLVDLETWQITVIAPPPLGLTATVANQQVTLNWANPYPCASSPDFRGFSVWRKTGCDAFIPDYCETGLGGRGYTKLTTANIFTYTYSDVTAVVGQQYSYRIVAHFSKLSPNGLFQFDPNESVPSNEVCVTMPVDVPVMLNVDVQQTDVVNGKIFVRWSKPLAGGNNLDTLINPPPYRFDLYRGNGFGFSNPVMVYSTADALSYSAMADTVFTDNLLDTKTTPWSYKVFFYSNNDTVGATPSASSIFLTVSSSDQSLLLSWQETVPWSNDSFIVFKQNKSTLLYEELDTVYTHGAADTGLMNDSTYCYFVRGFGHYELNTLPRPLVNNSQEACGVPIDTVPPCPPILTVSNDCGQYTDKPWNAAQFINYLVWTNNQDPCSEDIDRYYIYYGSDSANMTLLDSISSKDDTTYNHLLSESLAGCYAIQALDRVGNASRFSNVFCIDNCPYYVLPNTFTPNADGRNDVFHPFKPYRFVPKIEMKIFNRWGEEVFNTEDPDINWTGKDQNGKEVSEGVYLYAGFYYEQRLAGLVKKPLSGEKKGGGFIHLIRSK